MICVVLEAGYARLYPLTEYFPSPLLNTNENTILDRLLDDIYNARVERYVVVSNHKFIEYFNQWAVSKKLWAPITVLCSGLASNQTDMSLAAGELKLDDGLFVIAGDNVLDLSLTKFIEFAKRTDIKTGCDADSGNIIAWLCEQTTKGARAL